MKSRHVFIIPLVLASDWVAPDARAEPWNLNALGKAPAHVPAPEHSVGKVDAIFFDGLPWKGKPTKVFAYIGVPEVETGKKVPAMVLVHGGGGSAFAPWVKLWMDRGYAAIAMDTCGNVSGGGHENHTRHPDAGPEGWGGFYQTDAAVADQWPYHAVADVILAHSLLRADPRVDGNRVGITGVSWGGYLTCVAAGVDERFKMAIPVYGCGFLGENSAWLDDFKSIGPEKSAAWLQRWDPAVYLPDVTVPVLWVTGTNDFAYPLDSLRKSCFLPRGPRHLSIPGDMPHGHEEGQTPPVIHAFADSVLKEGTPLPLVLKTEERPGLAKLTFKPAPGIVKAELLHTADGGSWKERVWKTTAAILDADRGTAAASLPSGTTTWIINLHDSRGFVVSGEPVETGR